MKRVIKKLLSAALVLTVCCTMIPAAFAAESKPDEQLPESVLYYGSVEKIIRDENGELSALRLSSERYGDYVMKLSDETVWIDSGEKTVSDKATLVEGERLYVYHSSVSTRSMPPQSEAYAVVRNIPQDARCAQYMKIDSVEEKDGVVSVIADNGAVSFTVDGKTTFSPYETRNLVTLQDLQAKSHIMVWYSYSRDMKDLKASHIMLLPQRNTVITRGEFIQALYESKNCPEATEDIHFSDVSQDMDVYAAIAWAAEQGFAGGYGNGLFGVNDPISREQAVTILWRCSGSPMLMDYPGLTHYDDAGDISAFARKAMAWAHQKGLLDQQREMLKPQENVTENEVKAMLHVFFL